MTIPEIHNRVSAVKPVSQRQLQRYLAQLNIKPSGIRQRPQQYPETAPQSILAALGLSYGSPLVPAPQTRSSAGLISAKQLRKFKPATKAKK